MCLFGAVSALALLLWKRWGFYGLCLLTALSIPPLVMLAGVRPGLYGIAPGVVLLALTAVGLRRSWRFLD
jgi:hypothetical protein